MGTEDGSKPASSGTDDLLPTRQSLLHRLRDWEDHASWQTFFDTYWRLIYQVALKSGLTPVEGEEVVQETVVSVAKAMKKFRYDPKRRSFKGWLLQLTGWRITNQFKRRSKHLPSPAQCSDIESPEGEDPSPNADFAVPPDLEQLWDAEWEENLLRAALDRTRAQVNPKQFQIFDLYVLQKRAVREVRRFLDVSATEVYLAKHRVGRLVRKEAERLRSQML